VEEEIRVRLGRAIRDARRRKGISQTELGRLVGMSQRTISSLELGRVGLPVSDLYRIGKALDVDPIELLLAAWPEEYEARLENEDMQIVMAIKRLDPDRRELALRLIAQLR
jgi:transcriptional regulator with XRE-family HTH domain